MRLRPTGVGSVCFRAAEGAAFAEVQRRRAAAARRRRRPEGRGQHRLFGFTWLLVTHEPDELPALVTDLHAVNSTLQDNGFGPRCCARWSASRPRATGRSASSTSTSAAPSTRSPPGARAARQRARAAGARRGRGRPADRAGPRPLVPRLGRARPLTRRSTGPRPPACVTRAASSASRGVRGREGPGRVGSTDAWFGAVDLAAAEAADAVPRRSRWLRSAPYDELDLLPLSDGGPGFVDVLGSRARRPGRRRHGPRAAGRPGAGAGAARSATRRTSRRPRRSACTWSRPRPRPGRLPRRTAWGELLLAAAATGVRRVVVGVGGTATTDGGRGLVAALDGHRDELAGLELVAATATDAPLMGHSGAAHGFAARQGRRPGRPATRSRRPLREWATETDGGLAVRPGAGAGGGIGFGLLLLGAERVNGTALVAEADRAGRAGPGGRPGGDRARASSTGSRCAAGWSSG